MLLFLFQFWHSILTLDYKYHPCVVDLPTLTINMYGLSQNLLVNDVTGNKFSKGSGGEKTLKKRNSYQKFLKTSEIPK